MQRRSGSDAALARPENSVLGAVRPLAVVAGALVVLQSSENLDASKLAFFAVAILALMGSVVHAWRSRDSDLVKSARPWLIASAVVAAILAVSLPVALAHGTSVGSWTRDAAAYALIAAAPWLALDLGGAVSPRAAMWATAVAGALATISFSVTWIQRRYVADLPLDRLVLPSFALASALFALAVAHSVWGGRDRFGWAAVAAAVIGLLVITGTRTTLALAAVPIVVLVDARLVGGRERLRTSIVPVAAPLLVVGVLTLPGMLQSVSTAPIASGTPAAGAATPTANLSPRSTAAEPASTTLPATAAPGSPEPSATSQPTTPPPTPTLAPSMAAAPTPTPDTGGRFGTIKEVLAGQDASLRMRWEQTVAAWQLFLSSPLLGQGPGVLIPWVGWDGKLVNESWADTPFTVLAKFGVLGFVIWVVLGWATVLTMRRLRLGGDPGLTARAALLGFSTALVALSPFGPQLEDKGTGLALLLLLGLAFAVIRSANADSSSARRRPAP